MKYQGRARKRDENEPGIIAALVAAGASVVPQDKPTDLLVGYTGDTDLLEVKNGSQPRSWQRVTPDQEKFFNTWKGKPAKVVTTMREALVAIRVPGKDIDSVLLILSTDFDEYGRPR